MSRSPLDIYSSRVEAALLGDEGEIDSISGRDAKVVADSFFVDGGALDDTVDTGDGVLKLADSKLKIRSGRVDVGNLKDFAKLSVLNANKGLRLQACFHGGNYKIKAIFNTKIVSKIYVGDDFVIVGDLAKVAQKIGYSSLEVIACKIGAKITRPDHEESELIGISRELKDFPLIIHSGKRPIFGNGIAEYTKGFDIQDFLPKLCGPNIKRDINHFIKMIINNPETAHFLYNGESFTKSAIKPKDSRDLTDDGLKAHVLNTVQGFLQFCNNQFFKGAEVDVDNIIAAAQKRMTADYCKDYRRKSFLTEAISGKRSYLQSYVIKYNTGNVDERNDAFNTTLIDAHEDVSDETKTILQQQADPSALLSCCAYSDKYLSKMAALLGSGANANFVDRYGYTPIMRAALFNNLSGFRILLDGGANIDAADKDGGTPLFWSIYGDSVEVMAEIKRIFPDKLEEEIPSLFCAAVCKKNPEKIFERIFAAGEVTSEALNRPDRNGKLPLVEAVKSGNIGLVRILLAHGADPELDDKHCVCALSAAVTDIKKDSVKIYGELISAMDRRRAASDEAGEKYSYSEGASGSVSVSSPEDDVTLLRGASNKVTKSVA